MATSGMSWVYGSVPLRDEKAGRVHMRTYGVSLALTECDGWRGKKWIGYLEPAAVAAATDMVFVRSQIDETVIPGVYFYVCDWEGVIGR